MSEKLTAALTKLEQARTTALETFLAEKQYRALAILDAEGPIQRGINRCSRLVNDKSKTAKK